MLFSMLLNVMGMFDILRLILKFFVMLSFFIIFLSFLFVIFIVWVVFILCVKFRWYLFMFVIIIWCVLICLVIVVVMILIGFVFVINIFLFIKLNDNVVWIVLLNGLKIEVNLFEILFGILNVLKVGIIRYFVNVFLWLILILVVLWYKCIWLVW